MKSLLKITSRTKKVNLRGVFAQRGHSANHSVVYPGNTPDNHPPTEACMIHSKQHRGYRIQDPGTRGRHQARKEIPDVPAGAVGYRIQDPWLPAVENSRLFAQRAHSAGTAHGAPPWGRGYAVN